VRAVENAARARTSPAIYVANTDATSAKDPDALVREHGISAAGDSAAAPFAAFRSFRSARQKPEATDPLHAATGSPQRDAIKNESECAVLPSSPSRTST